MRKSKFEAAEGPPSSPERRDFMKTAALGAGVAATAGGALGGGRLVTPAAAHEHVEPWWPSRWGPEDQAGASNWMTPEKTLEAAQWIRDGRVYQLGKVYEAGMPTFGNRAFTVRIPGNPTGGPFGDNQLVYMDEFLSTEVGQVGTQWDGLGHIGLSTGEFSDRSQHRYYNGFTGDEVVGAEGLHKLGPEHCKPFFTRAHLVDMLGLRGEMWDVGEEITLADLRAALERQGMSEDDIQDGDGVFFNTGWGQLWMVNNDRFNSGCPGIGLEVAEFLIGKNIAVVGGDTWPVEVVPNPDPSLAFPVHAELIVKNGIYIHENLRFDDLIADGKSQFVYIYAPVRIKGATGSIGEPIAVT
jgi:kynurenine formamidase